MSYAKQHTTNERLHLMTQRALDKLGSIHYTKVKRIWSEKRQELQALIMSGYRLSASTGRWNLPAFKSSGAQTRISVESKSILEQFRALSHVAMKNAFNDLYRQSLLRHAWQLNQVTPISYAVKVPYDMRLHESSVSVAYVGKKSAQDWAVRWQGWVEAYHSSLNHNLSLGAMNESSISDAMDEVEATKVNTPASTLENALSRIYESEAVNAISEGADAVSDLNEDLVEEEIWKTRGDLRVCDDCDANEGLTAEEADGDIPYHPNCHCYWLVVPKDFAELLRSGTDEDKDLAEEILSRGLAPNSMVIRDRNGDVGAKIVVSFSRWLGEFMRPITSP